MVPAVAVTSSVASSPVTDVIVVPVAVPTETSDAAPAPASQKAAAPEPAAAEEAPAEQEIPASDTADLFDEALRIFGTSEIPTMPQAAASDDAPAATAHIVPPRHRKGARKLVTAGSTFAVMGVTTLLAVSMTLPSEAVAAAQGAQAFSMASLAASTSADAPVIEEEEIQAFIAPEDVSTESLARTAENYSTVSLVELAAQQGIRYSDTVYTNDPNAAIQWPFFVGVPMTSRYGMRWGRMHQGIDLVPGSGAPIQAIADGTVRIASEAGGAYGVHVYIDHVIDGMNVTSHYAHMQYGSLEVTAGQEVKVGDVLGKVGNTGRSYGAHLHFEILINGSHVDPLPFMNKYAGTY
ncbi:M23 family metallopeptidase [Microbacterium sp. NIBRBAC000506063]|uniref:M23 family metallopeptidase n=1 Tax=Microbacterium sp. NIBRBAC000506063 TaxID=2734618 RepID=UPI001CB6EB49|nr:M23 family metallopeptidase [Microbacterium sp. NIBRBAC000506063]